MAVAEESRVIVGEDLYVGPDERIDEVVCIGGTARVEGVVEGDVVVVAGTLELLGEAENVVVVAGTAIIDGRADDEMVLVATKTEFRENAAVGGDLVVVGQDVENLASVPVGGSIESTGWIGEMAFWGVLLGGALIVAMLVLAGPFLVLIAYALMGERRSIVLAETISQRPGMCFVVGLVSCFGFTLLWSVSMLLGLSLLGIDTLFFVVLVAVLVIGYTGVSLWVGRGLVGSSPFAATAFGAVLISLLQLIPVLGWILAGVYTLFAVGCVGLSGAGTSVDWLLRRTEAEPLRRSAGPPATPLNTP